MHENMFALSTAAHFETRERGPCRYSSAAEAVGCYFEFVELVLGAPGLDPERLAMSVQTQASPENPHLYLIEDIRNLACAFEHARRRASDKWWSAWVAYRVNGCAYRDVDGMSKSHARRVVTKIDAWVEQHLSGNGLLRQGYGDDRFDEEREILLAEAQGEYGGA